ncbi:hypothetical protein BGZ65_010918, partial [Modicella reniformis]
MVDEANVTGLDREKLHEPLTSYLDALKDSSDPYLVYQAAYVYQAPLCVPDETLASDTSANMKNDQRRVRTGEIAANSMWDAHIRRNAVSFLGEIYRNDTVSNKQLSIKKWIFDILMQLSSLSENPLQAAEILLQELKSSSDTKDQDLTQESVEKDSISYPLKVALPTLGSPSLLDRVQNKPDVEGNMRQLRKQRIKERGDAVYIQPQAKAGLQASDETRFPLMEKVKEFLNSNQKVFLLLGDSGAGKSTFNKALECELWQSYKKNTGTTPLHINLPAIEKPEHDMIAKQLRKAEFTEPEIRELK